MNISKCDICKKAIKGDTVRAGIGILREKDFCLRCGKPVLDFLRKHKFINIDKKK